MVDRIVVTGIGAVTPLGRTVEQTWQAVLAGASAVRAWNDLADEGFRATRACRVAEYDAPAPRRGQVMLLQASAEATSQAGLSGSLGPSCGIYVGSTLGESGAFEAAAAGAEIDLADHMVPSFGRALAKTHGATGPTQAFATACAGGNYALAGATRALRQHRVSVALACGVDPFSRISMVGFSRSRAMATETCRPFDEKRNGMILGEGAAVLVLEREADARARGATPLATLEGAGFSADAHHPTAPRPDGSGMAQAMRAALAEAGRGPDEIGWISVHGSGTRASDAAEGMALNTLFDDAACPPLVGFKGALGHGLGAASAIAAALIVRAFDADRIPPTAGFDQIDPKIGLGCTTTATPIENRRVVLANAFAFGGLNSALVLSA